jgi:hypothetical protein
MTALEMTCVSALGSWEVVFVVKHGKNLKWFSLKSQSIRPMQPYARAEGQRTELFPAKSLIERVLSNLRFGSLER